MFLIYIQAATWIITFLISESSSSNYGITGVLELPNARFMKEASVSWNFSGSFPNEYTSITASPFSWMESSYRYTGKESEIWSFIFSRESIFEDKGFDLKIRLRVYISLQSL